MVPPRGVTRRSEFETLGLWRGRASWPGGAAPLGVARSPVARCLGRLFLARAGLASSPLQWRPGFLLLDSRIEVRGRCQHTRKTSPLFSFVFLLCIQSEKHYWRQRIKTPLCGCHLPPQDRTAAAGAWAWSRLRLMCHCRLAGLGAKSLPAGGAAAAVRRSGRTPACSQAGTLRRCAQRSP